MTASFSTPVSRGISASIMDGRLFISLILHVGKFIVVEV
jgi:hypothetical protein